MTLTWKKYWIRLSTLSVRFLEAIRVMRSYVSCHNGTEQCNANCAKKKASEIIKWSVQGKIFLAEIQQVVIRSCLELQRSVSFYKLEDQQLFPPFESKWNSAETVNSKESLSLSAYHKCFETASQLNMEFCLVINQSETPGHAILVSLQSG